MITPVSETNPPQKEIDVWYPTDQTAVNRTRKISELLDFLFDFRELRDVREGPYVPAQPTLQRIAPAVASADLARSSAVLLWFLSLIWLAAVR